MNDSVKTRSQITRELQEARRQLAALAAVKAVQSSVADSRSPPEEKFYKAFLATPDMIIIISLATGKYLEVNDSFTGITGYSREELVGHGVEVCNLFATPEEQQRMARLLDKEGGVKNEEFQFRMRSGEIRTWLCSTQPVEIDGDPCMIAVAVDITCLKKAEQALRDSEEKFFKAFRNSPQAIAITSLKDGRVIDVNEGQCRLTGYPRETLIGHSTSELGFWMTQADRQDFVRRLKENGRVINEEIIFRSTSGEPHVTLFSADLISINGEECMISSCLDIDDRLKTARALKESEEKFAKAFASSPITVCLINIASGRFVEVNDNFRHFTGFTCEEVLGKTPAELNLWVNPADLDMITRSLQQTGTLNNAVIRSRMKSGEIRTGLFSAQVIDIGGEPSIILVINDITELTNAQEALKESEERFAKAFRSGPLAISITRVSDGVFMEVNDSFSRNFGFTRDEVVGRSSLELGIWLKPSDREKLLDMLKAQGSVRNQEFFLRNRAGEIRSYLLSAEQIECAGKLCLLVMTNDITDYKRMASQLREAENLKELDRLRTELLANVSHELRTPLASIKGFATMMLDYEKRLTATEKREYLETIDKNADRLVELIETLLEMSRIGAGMLSINRTRANIGHLCRDVIAAARLTAASHRFRLVLPPRLPRISVDVERIRQVLNNLIDNAVKYSRAGQEVSLAVRVQDKEMLFTVTDHGIGIAREDLPKVFDRIFHAPRKQKPGFPGAGLGLPLCKALIGAHGGRIWLDSEENKGTKVYFALPLDDKVIPADIQPTLESLF